MFYEFDQNNSGGSFDFDDERGVGVKVWVEADNADDANTRAEGLGIYFNGCEDGSDCPCCGDRWYPAYGDGEDHPTINDQYDFEWHPVIYLHTKDGKIHRLHKDDARNASPIFLIEGRSNVAPE